jgi:hypothetical protein
VLMPPQWRNGKRSLMTDPSKSAYASNSVLTLVLTLTTPTGTHIYYQTRHCEHKQADSWPPELR